MNPTSRPSMLRVRHAVGKDVLPADKSTERFVNDCGAGVWRHEISLKCPCRSEADRFVPERAGIGAGGIDAAGTLIQTWWTRGFPG